MLGPVVHRLGADLHLQRLALRTHHRRVQRLVEVELGHRDVVLEPALDRSPGGVDRAQRGVAVPHRAHQHADADEVEDLLERAPLDHHLLVDGPQVLGPSGDLRRDPQLGQAGLHVPQNLLQVDVALGGPLLDHLVDLGVAARLQSGEGEVLKLLLDVLHPEAVSQRRVHVEGLAGDVVLLESGQHSQSAQVVQPVGQLDDQHPQIPGYGHDHLAHRGGLLLLAGVVLDPVELGDPVDYSGDLRTEVGLDGGQGDIGVLHRVVQQRSGDGDVVEPEPGHDGGHRHRMADVRLPRQPHLPRMGIGRHVEGPDDQVGRSVTVALAVQLQQRSDLRGGGPPGSPTPGQDPGDGGH